VTTLSSLVRIDQEGACTSIYKVEISSSSGIVISGTGRFSDDARKICVEFTTFTRMTDILGVAVSNKRRLIISSSNNQHLNAMTAEPSPAGQFSLFSM
jgi:hypothetical protein